MECSNRGYAGYGSDFHNDHSFEVSPPAYTILRMNKTPPNGGDTIFTSQVALFDKLSTTYQRILEGLHGVHSSEVRLDRASPSPHSPQRHYLINGSYRHRISTSSTVEARHSDPPHVKSTHW